MVAVFPLLAIVSQPPTPQGPPFPRIANCYGIRLVPDSSPEDIAEVAKWDLLIGGVWANWGDPESVRQVREKMQAVRGKNPHVIILDFSSSAPYADPKDKSFPESGWLLQPDGSRIEGWPGTQMINLTKPEVVDWLAARSVASVREKGFGGTFIDCMGSGFDGWACNIESGKTYEIDADGDREADDRRQLDEQWTAAKTELSRKVREALGPGSDETVARHFTPRYDPWDQRLCLVPNADFFTAMRRGAVEVVTDEIATLDETGILLASGARLDADIIVTATGLRLVTPCEAEFVVDGERVDFARTWTYKGLAFSGVPNLVTTFGYINASWTLRADLVAAYVCRLLRHMSDTGTQRCTPRLRASDRDMVARPWIEGFSSGYMQRAMHLMPRQGDRAPWLNPQDYAADRRMLRRDPVDDGVMCFEAPAGAAVAARP